MIQSELLIEKYRVQKYLSEKSVSIHEYLKQSQLAAKATANSYGFAIRYVEMPNKALHRKKKVSGVPASVPLS